ncbi:MAG: hypothetical protein GX911_03925 [Spirochaetales bacterium]|nr:hypothetical protein [Spirochaetales bacterium]
MKRTIGVMVAIVIGSSLFALPVALSFETWNSKAISSSAASAGVSVGVLPHLEVQGALLLEMEGRIGGVGTLTFALVAPHFYRDPSRAPLYYNALVGVGYLGGWDRAEGKPFGEIFIRATPLSLGAAYYRTRERTFGFGIGFDHYTRSWSFIVNIFAFDRYL